MKPTVQPDTQLSRIEEQLAETEALIMRQRASVNRLRERLLMAAQSSEWYSVQFGELFRIMARDVREFRAMLIWSVVSDQPISAEMLQVLLQATMENSEEEPPRCPPFCTN